MKIPPTPILPQPWHFNNRPLAADFYPGWFYGFIYLITCIPTGKLYIGRKAMWYRQKVGKKKFKLVESDWESYFGSSKPLKRHINEIGVENFKKEILEFCLTRKNLHRREAQLLLQIKDFDKFYNSPLSLKHLTHPKRRGRIG